MKKTILKFATATALLTYGLVNATASEISNLDVKKECNVEVNGIEKVIATVKKWSKEHPRKTISQDFLEKYPKAELAYNKFPEICPHSLGYATNKECFLDTDEQFVSEECEECWNRPLEEE